MPWLGKWPGIGKSGTVNLGAAGSSVVTFATAFPQGVTPLIFLQSQFDHADTSCAWTAHSISNTGFTMHGVGTPAGLVAWWAFEPLGGD